MISKLQNVVKPRRILLVDDDQDYGKMLRFFAKEHGIRVDSVTSQSMRFVVDNAETYDVVLLNYDFEKFTGLEAAEVLGHARPHTPLVMVSTTLCPWQRGGREAPTIRACVSKWEGLSSVLTAAMKA